MFTNNPRRSASVAIWQRTRDLHFLSSSHITLRQPEVKNASNNYAGQKQLAFYSLILSNYDQKCINQPGDFVEWNASGAARALKKLRRRFLALNYPHGRFAIIQKCAQISRYVYGRFQSFYTCMASLCSRFGLRIHSD